jgi:hypothetical protein
MSHTDALEEIDELNIFLAPYRLAIEHTSNDQDPEEMFTLYSVIVTKTPISERLNFHDIKEYALRCVGSIVIYKRII